MQQISLITSTGRPPPAEACPITASGLDVCYGSKSDMCSATADARLVPKADIASPASSLFGSAGNRRFVA